MQQSSKAGGWIAGTVFLSLLILAAAWLLGISPLLQTASETRDQAAAQLDQNVITKNKISKLKEQFANKDQLQADLVALREQIPTTGDLATYRRQLAEVAAARGVTIVSLSTGTANSIAPVAPAAAAADDATTEESGASTDDAQASDAQSQGTTTAASEGPAAYGVPVAINVLGTYDAVVAFLADLQGGVKRLMVVEQLSGTAPAPSDASAGKPAIAQGDLELVITGQIFVLPDPAKAAAGAESDPAAQPVPLPPANGRNPLVTNG